MKLNRKIFLIPVIMFALASCSKDDDLNIVTPPGLGGDNFEPTAVDQWLFENLTTPYNISVKYRWDPWELALDKTLTPPDESKIIPAMSSLIKTWIEPYNEETGSAVFMKKYLPKQFKLVGSVQYEVDGSVILGQAEGGNNVALFDINQNFLSDPMESEMFRIHAAHHEFAHILHQNVIYPTEFIGVSGKSGFLGYTVTWFNITEEEARENGYVTPYAASGVVDDFAEQVSTMLMYGKTRFDEVVESVNDDAAEVLRTKEQIVVNYFREVWDIDFYSLQARVNAALLELAPVPAIQDAYGFEKNYTIASVDINNQGLLPQRAAFTLMVQDAADQVAAIPQFGLTLDSFAVVATGEGEMTLRMYIGQDGNVFFADFHHTESVAGDVHDYTYVDANENGDLIKGEVQAILDYIANNQFRISWYADPSVSIFPRAKFTTVASSSDYFIALLLP